MSGNPVRNSYVEMIQQVLPSDTNPHGTVFGGKVMQWIDIAGAVSAMRHAKGPVVTASFDAVDFHAPGKVGDIMILKAQVNFVGKTSLEVGVEVHAENPASGKRVLTTDALITYVAINPEGRPIKAPPLMPESKEEKRRFEEAKKRRENRLKRYKKS